MLTSDPTGARRLQPCVLVMRAAATGLLLLQLAGGCSEGRDVIDTDDHGPSQDDVHGGVSLTTVTIASSAFMMGCNVALVAPCDTDEQPYHAVMLSSFEIDRFETSQLAYRKCIDAHACTTPVDTSHWSSLDLADYPVVGVSWAQAQAYCAWTGRRLPSEAEWERAARGTSGATWPWGNQEPDCLRANYQECGRALHPIGVAPHGGSPDGAMDMAGNALEWVADWYAVDAYEAAGASLDPTGPATGLVRVLRGGGFLSDARSVRSSYRGSAAPDAPEAAAGFRCARSITTTGGTE